MSYVENKESAVEGETHAQRRFLGALRHSDFILFWIGLFVSSTGSWMQSVAQGWLVFQLTHSEFKLGLVTAMGTFPILLTTLHAGVVADRFNKRKIITVTQTLAMVQAAILAALAFTNVIQFWHILALASFAGFINAVDVPVRQSMTVELVGKEDLPNAVSLTSLAFNIARIIGPAVAGVIVAISSSAMCFLVNAISFLAIIFMLLIIKPRRSKPSSSEVSALSQITEGVRYVRSNRLLFDLVVMTAVASLFVLQYATLLPALAKEVLHAGPAQYGLLVSAAGWGAVCAAMAVALIGHKVKQGMIVVCGSFIAPLGLVALAFSHSLSLSTMCLVLIGFGMMMFLAVSNSLVQLVPPDELRGRVLSVRTLMFMGLAPFGALLVGTVAQYAGVQRSILIGALIFLATTAYIVASSPAVREAE